MAKAKNSHTSADQVVDQVVDIIRFMGENKLAEIELETPELKLKLKKHSQSHFHAAHSPATQISMPTMPFETARKLTEKPAITNEKASAAEIKTNYQTVASPMTGTFYAAASPDSKPYVMEGDLIKAGQTICIIEAMKMMNEIKSDKAGKVMKILMQNGKPIEKGAVIIHVGE